MEFEIQKAIFEKLDTGLTVPVYDHVPQDSENFPYVQIGNDTFIDYSGDDFVGMDGDLNIHTWSSYKGKKEIKALQNEIYNLLNRADLTIIGYNVINIEQVYSNTFLESDGITRHGVQRYRVLITKD